jgi:predicted lysophospholipase L1 biosynthesis ABC-type transport system permease subunit
MFEVIGVARDAKYGALWEPARPFAYFMGSQVDFPPFNLHVSALGDPRRLFAPVRKAIETAEPTAQVGSPHLISEQISSSLSQEKSLAGLLGLFGVLGLLVTAVGLYGMFSFVTAQRTREFGIRMALGARQEDLLRQICRQGATLVLAGLAVAFPCSYGLTRFIESRLHGVGPFDLLTYAAVSLVCVVAATVAVLIPARRATAKPTDALRFE